MKEITVIPHAPPNFTLPSLFAALLFLTAVTNGSAAFFESFEDSAFPPPGWSKTNTLGGSGWYRLQSGVTPLPGWVSGTSSVPPIAGAGNYTAYCTWDTGGGTEEGYHNSQYLITPGLNGLTATSTLSFWLKGSFTNFRDSVRILISTNRPIPADFTYTNLVLDFPQAGATSDFPPYTNIITPIGTHFPPGTRIYIAFHEWELDNLWEAAAIELDVVSSDLTPDSEVRAMPPSLMFTTYPGDPVDDQVLTYTNIGAAGFTYSNSFPLGGGVSGWASISPPATTGFVNRIQSLAITVSVNPGALPAGTYAVTNRLTVPYATNSPLDVPIILSIVKRPQFISFPNPGAQWTTNSVSLAATAESELPILFAVESGPGSIANGSNLTFSASGIVQIVATQPGNGYWAPVSATQSFTVAKVDSRITFLPIPDQITTNPCLLSASATSGEPVSFSILEGPALLHFGSFLTFQSAGMVRIVAAEPGNDRWNAAPVITNLFFVNKARAGIALLDLAQTYDGAPHPVTATTDPEGFFVTITYNGSATPPINAGSYRVAGEVNVALYNGLSVDTLVVARAASILDFPPIPDQKSTNQLTLQATASSGLPVTFTVAEGPAVLTAQTHLAFTGGGTVRIVASQSGNTNWTPARPVTNSFNVIQDPADVILSNLDHVYDGTPKAAIAQTFPTGLTVHLFYDGASAEPIAAGVYAVSGIVADLQYQGVATGTLQIVKADQTIAFAPLTAQRPPQIVPLQAIASSHLPVEFLLFSGPGQVTDGSNLNFSADGVVIIAARQTGDANWNPAPDVTQTVRVSRLATVGDYNNDGTTDLTVYHPQTFDWYSVTPNGATIICWAVQWGSPHFIPVPGDYTGTGSNELTVFSPTEGAWYLYSLNPLVTAWKTLWGGPGMVPVWGDYDGDARYDYGVYAIASGAWYVSSSTGSVPVFNANWGAPDFKPVPGDYDADGQFDLAVYDPASGNWYIRAVNGTVLAWARNWGGPGMDPIPGDYNGDGRYDLAVFHRDSGKWYISTLAGSVLAWDLPFGWKGAIPVPGDYDYDGSSDLAVYNPDTGDWYVFSPRKNTGLIWKRNWGANGLLPVVQ